MPSKHPIILASASPTRRILLERLGLPFEIDPADIDESARPDETPQQLCQRLAAEKAACVLARHPQAIVIGSDQLLECNATILGKPGNAEQARAQLERISGQTVIFHVGLTICTQATRFDWHETVTTTMRTLDPQTIERYIEIEQPFACAGSMRSEGLGAALVESMQSNDPSAILGMPMIATARGLRAMGADPLG